MTIDRSSFIFAIALSVGSLVFYILIAVFYRRDPDAPVDPHIDFNLGIPRFRNINSVFAASLLAAGTSLSTVLVFFLTLAPVFGWWLVLCPVMFAVGNLVLYRVYRSAVQNGYFVESDPQIKGVAGLVPYLIYRVTGSSAVGWIALFLTALNLVAVLTLELIVGVRVLQYLILGAFGFQLGPLLEFVAYAISVGLLLGYVFIGGFRASVASDQYQAMAMKIALVIATTALGVALVRFSSVSVLSQIPVNVPFNVLGFYLLNVVLANLFVPLAQEASWQRFRAFTGVKHFDPSKATVDAVLQSAWLWGLIIISAFLLFVLTPVTARAELVSITGCFEHIRLLGRVWFPVLVFPLMVIAGLSAMYSTADTCVAALLYLIEYARNRPGARAATPDATALDYPYYFAMTAIFLLSLAVYAFVRYVFSPTIMQLVFSVFSNLVVLAPAILLTGILKPYVSGTDSKLRFGSVLLSIFLGSAAYWSASLTAMAFGGSYLWLSEAAIAIGLLVAALPLMPLFISSRKATLSSR